MTNSSSAPSAPSAPSGHPGGPADPRGTLYRACDQVVGLIRRATPADAKNPTPCADFDVAALVGHLLAVLHRVAYVAGGGHAFDVPSTHDIPADEWAASATERAAALKQAWQDDTVLDRVLTLPWGQVPGRGAAMAYVQELTTHAWDLAVALGHRTALDPELGAIALATARRVVPDVDRGKIPFGPVVPVPDDASVYDRLVGWLGRDPSWTARP